MNHLKPTDLDLGHFCDLIGAELHEICAHPNPDFSFVFSDDNQPFGLDDPRSAAELLVEYAGAHGFHRDLAKHFVNRWSQANQKKGKGEKTKRSVEVVYV